MATHTPGPWTLTKFPSDLHNNPVRFRIEGKTTLLLDVEECADGFVEGENEANAILIKACPTMYEALQKIANGDYDNAHDPKAAAKIAAAVISEIALPTE